MQILKGKSRRLDGRWASRKEKNFSLILLLITILVGLVFWNSHEDVKLQAVLYPTVLFRQPDQVPVARAVESVANTADLGPTPEPGTKEEIRQMIKEAFPEDPKVAVAVGTSESVGLNPNAENRGKANGKYKGECSIGLFQINLRSDGCMGKPVHWDKVPGETLEAKVAWLKVPKNNIKIARDIYVIRGKNWLAWGAYTNGSYKKHLK